MEVIRHCSGMANIQLLHPCPIIGVAAGRSHGDPDKSRYQSGERLNKYSDGDHGEWLVTQ